MDDGQTQFGHSFLLVDGDLRVENGGLAEISGRDNLMQGIRIMIETPLGSDPVNVNYGFDLLGILQSAQTTRMTKDLIRLNIVKSISQDNRVREITDVVFDDDPRFFDIQATETIDAHTLARKTARRWQALVVLTTITGADFALKVEGTTL